MASCGPSSPGSDHNLCRMWEHTTCGGRRRQGTGSGGRQRLGHAPDTAGKFLLIGSDGSTIRVPVGPRGLYLAHVPPGTYGVGGQVDSYYGSNLACSTEPSTFRVTSKRTTTVPVGLGLP